MARSPNKPTDESQVPGAIDPSALRIVQYPHPALRAVAKPIDRIDSQVQAVARRMLDMTHQAQGVGLAAPQVGLSWRMFVANPTGEPTDDRVFVNPVLSNPAGGSSEREEGCLSIPNVNGMITRHAVAAIDALDLDGNKFQLQSDDLTARIWQHEMDHLNGILIIDRMPTIDRMANRRTLKDLEAAFKK